MNWKQLQQIFNIFRKWKSVCKQFEVILENLQATTWKLNSFWKNLKAISNCRLKLIWSNLDEFETTSTYFKYLQKMEELKQFWKILKQI